MRIIAGKYKSRTIRMPKGAKVRPTKDRIREALFNMITPYIRGAAVLDTFAGSGAFGIEAVSRGAGHVVFVEKDRRCVDTIRKNLETLGVGPDSTSIIKMDAFRAFDMLGRGGEKFDIILLDPPYYSDMAKKSLIKLNRHDILTSRCIIIAEHHKKDALPEDLDVITTYRKASYGDIRLTFYRLKNKEE